MVRATTEGCGRRVVVRSRDGHGDDRPQKVGGQVRRSVAEAVKAAVENGAAKGQSAFVEEALLRRLKELRRDELYLAYEEAAQDPVFMDDMQSVAEAFCATVQDGIADES